jgi:hypothetical protein
MSTPSVVVSPELDPLEKAQIWEQLHMMQRDIEELK